MPSYFYIQPQIVGTFNNYKVVYNSDFRPFDYITDALSHAYRILGHDDFLIAQKETGTKVIKLFNSDGGERILDQQEIKEINKQLF